MSSPHAILGVSASATQQEVRTAWRALVRKSHPDVAGNPEMAEDRMKAINAAYDAMLSALQTASAPRRPSYRKTSASAGKSDAPKAARRKAAPKQRAYPARPCPSPERPFSAPRRIALGPVLQARMQSAVLGRLRRLLSEETARLGGGSYSVPGQADWPEDTDLLSHGLLPKQHVVAQVELVGQVVRLKLDTCPDSGPILLAVPRLVQQASGALRVEGSATVLALAIPRSAAWPLRLSDENAGQCFVDGTGLAVEVHVPMDA